MIWTHFYEHNPSIAWRCAIHKVMNTQIAHNEGEVEFYVKSIVSPQYLTSHRLHNVKGLSGCNGKVNNIETGVQWYNGEQLFFADDLQEP